METGRREKRPDGELGHGVVQGDYHGAVHFACGGQLPAEKVQRLRQKTARTQLDVAGVEPDDPHRADVENAVERPRRRVRTGAVAQHRFDAHNCDQLGQCYENEQVYLQSSGGSWTVITSGTGVTCDDIRQVAPGFPTSLCG